MIIWGSQIFGNASYVVETLDLVMGLKEKGVEVRLIPYENLHHYLNLYMLKGLKRPGFSRRMLLAAGHACLSVKGFNRFLEKLIEPFGSFSWDLTSAPEKDRKTLRESCLYDKHRVIKTDLGAGASLIYVSQIMATKDYNRCYFRTVDENLRLLAKGGMPRRTYHVGRFMFETDRIHSDCIRFINRFDEVWVPSRFCRDIYQASGMTRPVCVMPESLDTDLYRGDVPPLPIPGKRGFNFLTVLNRVSPRTFNSRRKGWQLLLGAFLKEFRQDEDVALILKISKDRETETQIQEEIRKNMKRDGGEGRFPSNILLYRERLSPEDMPGLYRAVDAYVMPSRGEGWGRPFMEAMCMGLPTIGTGWGGHTDFMDPTGAYLLDFHLVDCPTVFKGCKIPLAEGHRWAEPSAGHLRRTMREVYENREESREKGRKARRDILEKYNRRAVAEKMHRRLMDIQKELKSIR